MGFGLVLRDCDGDIFVVDAEIKKKEYCCKRCEKQKREAGPTSIGTASHLLLANGKVF